MRVLFVYLAKTQTHLLSYMALPAFLIACGFFIIFFKGLRKTGAETFGEPIWWNGLRPIHGLLYLCFAIAAYNGWKSSYQLLLMDVLIGICSWAMFHFW
jgi:hypothetical protein